ncbi:DUF4381 domain-containing protein [Oceanospirillum beijerinckii]|uniref:DUF4381 domain-containing protein n=1 Tax=Oceanospirillum beijerinckii TaxID=64976 RepID=UPI0003FC9E26|nr:DUF4381 domain-containing protein [Oceanospirillum beijerinckii]
MNNQQPLLEQLKDIHLPTATPGWQVLLHNWWPALALLLTLSIGLLGFYWLKRRNLQGRTRHYALNELSQMQDRFQQHNQSQQLLNELNVLLRRMAIEYYGREEVASLSGNAWLSFLDKSGHTHDFTSGPGQVLIQLYQPEAEAFDEKVLMETVKQWICRQA